MPAGLCLRLVPNWRFPSLPKWTVIILLTPSCAKRCEVPRDFRGSSRLR